MRDHGISLKSGVASPSLNEDWMRMRNIPNAVLDILVLARTFQGMNEKQRQMFAFGNWNDEYPELFVQLANAQMAIESLIAIIKK